MGCSRRLLHPTMALLGDLGTLGHAPEGARLAVPQGCCRETWCSPTPSEEEVVQSIPASPPPGCPYHQDPLPQGMGQAAPVGVNLPLGAPSQGSLIPTAP